MKDGGEKASEEDRKALEDEIATAKSQLESEDKEVLEKAASNLSDKMQKVGAAMYADAPGAESAPEEIEKDEKDGQEPVEGEVVDEGGEK